MFVAMNRFQIKTGHEEEFEAAWRQRDSHLSEFQGFQSFRVLRSQAADGGSTEFITYSTWDSQDDFDHWKSSPDFRESHAALNSLQDALAGPPRLALYTGVISEGPGSA